MDYMFNDPAMLDDLDFLYKSDNARKILFYFQPEETKEDEEEKNALKTRKTNRNISVMQKKDEEKKPGMKLSGYSPDNLTLYSQPRRSCSPRMEPRWR